MGFIEQKHVIIALLIFDKKAMAYWPTCPPGQLTPPSPAYQTSIKFYFHRSEFEISIKFYFHRSEFVILSHSLEL